MVPPEIVSRYDYKIVTWQFGLILHFLLTGRHLSMKNP